MICNKCKQNFEERDLHESHDVPCYLFIKNGNRKGQKNQADKLGRHWLCKKCHDKYEDYLNSELKAYALDFSKHFFKEDENGVSI